MAKDHSFDIASEVNLQEVTNAVEQSRKEVVQRYDFKGSQTSINWDKTDLKITVSTENDLRLRSVLDILKTRFAKRGVSVRSIEYASVEKASHGFVRQLLTIRKGIPQDTAREIVKYIKGLKVKAQSQIQNDQVRVQSSKIDTLQDLIKVLRTKDFGLDIQFLNYR